MSAPQFNNSDTTWSRKIPVCYRKLSPYNSLLSTNSSYPILLNPSNNSSLFVLFKVETKSAPVTDAITALKKHWLLQVDFNNFAEKYLDQIVVNKSLLLS